MSNNGIHDKVREQFGSNAEKYVSSVTHARGSDLSNIVPWLAPDGTETALDIATGGGHVAKALAPHVGHVYAADLTPDMLSAARQHLSEAGIRNTVYVQADAESLPFLPETFDIVTCRVAAHHFPHPQLFVKEVARVLKPHGRFILIDNVAPENRELADFVDLVESIRDPSHVHLLSVSEWTSLLQEHGLKVVRTESLRKKFEFQPWLQRMAPTRAHELLTESGFAHCSEAAREYFDVVTNEQGVQSWTGDQWMVLTEKG